MPAAIICVLVGGCGTKTYRHGTSDETFCADHAVATRYGELGTGSPADPFRICTAAQLDDIALNPSAWARHFVLMSDLGLSQESTRHQPIGTGSGTAFTGTFDGRDHTISGFTIEDTTADDVGLFGYVQGAAAAVRNLRLVGVDVSANYYVGALVGTNEGATVEHCSATGHVAGAWTAGGLVGRNSGEIERSWASVAVLGGDSSNFGGLVGDNESGGTIRDCFAAGTVDNLDWTVGGLAGGNAGSVVNSFATGAVTAGIGGAGGLVGHNGGGAVTASFATGDVHGDWTSSSLGPCFGQEPGGTCYFDSASSCINDSGSCNSDGIAVDVASQPDYFFDRHNPPLSSWDFDSIWRQRSGDYPALR